MNIEAYTDGACSRNPGKGGIGAVILANGKAIKQVCEGWRKTTNNRMEILAAAVALEKTRDWLHGNGWLKENRIGSKDTDVKVTVLSDSQLVVNTMTQGWSTKTNKDLWSRLESIIRIIGTDFGISVEFKKVKGHSGNKYNDMADELAVYGYQQRATNVDVAYEDINKDEPDTKAAGELSVKNIYLLHADEPKKRLVEVSLSNGTTVKISGYGGGFSQYNCTQEESRVTIDIAWRFTGWLNGGEL